LAKDNKIYVYGVTKPLEENVKSVYFAPTGMINYAYLDKNNVLKTTQNTCSGFNNNASIIWKVFAKIINNKNISNGFYKIFIIPRFYCGVLFANDELLIL
jgi:hypothetical protein